MKREKFMQTWKQRLYGWWDRWRRGFGFLPVNRTLPDSPYPDYVACPHCGEPEVEVWSYEKLARCHNCGRTFVHALPPGGEPESAEKNPPPAE